MAEYEFDFCPNTRVAEVIAPEEASIRDFNGWDYSPTPVLPYRRSFKVTLEGLRWRVDDYGRLDTATEPQTNAGRLEQFYTLHRKYKPFIYSHEYLGLLKVRFSNVLSVPKATPNSGGLLEPLELMFIHHDPEYSEL